MPIRTAPWLACLLFPKLPPHQQRQSFQILVAALIVGLLVAGGVGYAIYMQASLDQVH